MGFTRTEIKIEILISFSNFTKSSNVLQQQKCSAIALSGLVFFFFNSCNGTGRGHKENRTPRL